MKVYSKHNFEFNKYNVGDLLTSSGADGELFYSDKNVIKFVEIKDSKKQSLNSWNSIKYKIEFIIKNNPNHFVTTYDCGVVKCFGNDKEYFIIYFYLMEKLNKISSDESKLFHSILSHEDSNKVKNKDYTKDILEMNRFLDFDKNKVFEFLNKIKKSKIQQLDVHQRNIMKDDSGNFKFIDLERLKL